MAQHPYVGSRQIRTDSVNPPQGFTIERRGVAREVSIIHIAMFQGMASLGNTSNYHRIPAYWVETQACGPDGKSVQRQCWRFTGKEGDARADKAYRSILKNAAETWPNAVASFPTAPQLVA